MFIFYGQLPHNNVVILFMEIHLTIYILQFRITPSTITYNRLQFLRSLYWAVHVSHITNMLHLSVWVDVFLGCFKFNESATLISYRNLWKWELSLGLGFVLIIVGGYKKNLCVLYKQFWHTYSSYGLEVQLNCLAPAVKPTDLRGWATGRGV